MKSSSYDLFLVLSSTPYLTECVEGTGEGVIRNVERFDDFFSHAMPE